MATFNKIVEKYIESPVNPFGLLYIYSTKIKDKPELKFKELDNILFHSFLMNETKKEDFLNTFSKIQKIYYAFSKLAHLFKFKKAIVRINTDLNLNILKEDDNKVFVLLHNNSKYFFLINELVNILLRNLYNTDVYFTAEPLHSKNPYNNINFSICDLYNIYFSIQKKNIIMPELIQSYFISNFNMRQFKIQNEIKIVNHSIKNYIYFSHHTTLLNSYKKMWEKYFMITKYVIIHEEFPLDKLINIMRPYLHLYYKYLYGLSGTIEKYHSEYLLYNKINIFVRYNTLFGRKYIKIINGKKVVTFNEKHAIFHNEYNVHTLPKLTAAALNILDDN